jgi:hypothetical protein
VALGLVPRSPSRAVLAAVVLACVVSGPSALGHDHRRPTSVLLSGEERQRGEVLRSGWIRPFDERMCVVTFADFPPSFPDPVPYEVGEQARIRLRKPAAPTYVELLAWKRVDGNGRVKGEPIPIPFHLQPRVENGEIRAWDAVFTLPPGQKHFYLLATADWRDEEGCVPEPDIGGQYVTWKFHLAATRLRG